MMEKMNKQDNQESIDYIIYLNKKVIPVVFSDGSQYVQY